MPVPGKMSLLPEEAQDFFVPQSQDSEAAGL